MNEERTLNQGLVELGEGEDPPPSHPARKSAKTRSNGRESRGDQLKELCADAGANSLESTSGEDEEHARYEVGLQCLSRSPQWKEAWLI